VHIAPGYQAIAAYAGIVVDRGRGCEILDVDGNRFLDVAAGVCVASLGYGHPDFVREVAEQLGRTHVGSFTSEARVRALEAVASVLPSGLERVQLYSGGAEAVESAMRLARAHTGKHEVLSFWGGFHGKTAGALAQMGSDFKHGLGPLAPGAYLTPYADCPRCPFKLRHPSCALLCVQFARDKLERETSGRLAAVLVEPMQGTAGNVIPPPDFLPAVAELARDKGALLIADEMITGFGRTGRWFAVEHTGVRPDVMTLGKALGGGLPVSAVAARHDVAQAEPWSKPSFSSSSYGGNPLAGAAVASAVGLIRRDRLVDNAREVGERMLAGFRGLAERFRSVAYVRGAGLMIGFDLVEPREPERYWSHARCRALFSALLRRGLISMAYAPRVRVNPPLLLSAAEADEAVGIFAEALEEVGA
jgi:4-aminobutyrate aminotransferase-like enzyme